MQLDITDPERPRYQGADLPKLDAVGTQALCMHPSQVTDIGPLCVMASTGRKSGTYTLTVRVNSVPKPLSIDFSFTDASQWTDDCTAAQHRKTEADRLLNTRLKDKSDQDAIIRTVHKEIADKLAAAQTPSCMPDVNTWQNVQQQCLVLLQQLHEPRAAKISSIVTATERQTLHQTNGVLGFVSELLGVADVTDARLLSWFAQSRLETLVVATWDVKLAVEQLWVQWSKPWPLTILPLDGTPSASHLLQQPLPHTGRQ